MSLPLCRVSQGNKGAVSVRLAFYGHSLCFLNCHLAAHMQHASQRLDEFERILDVQTFEGPQAPSVLDHRSGAQPLRGLLAGVHMLLHTHSHQSHAHRVGRQEAFQEMTSSSAPSGWSSGSGISTSASRTMACTLCAPVSRTRPTSCSGARTR